MIFVSKRNVESEIENLFVYFFPLVKGVTCFLFNYNEILRCSTGFFETTNHNEMLNVASFVFRKFS